MGRAIFVAVLMYVIIPLASHAIPITSIDTPMQGYSPAQSSAQASIILSKGFSSVKPPSYNAQGITVTKPAEPNGTKTTRTTALNLKKQALPDIKITLEPVVPGNDNRTTAPVPEPATMLLVGSGLIGVAILRKKIF